MKTFTEYMDKMTGNDPMNQPSLGGTANEKPTPAAPPEQSDNAVDAPKEIEKPNITDDVLLRVAKLAYKKFRHQTERFFTKLGDMDSEIKDALHGDKATDRGMDNFNPDMDEVVPPESDGAPGLEKGDQE